MISQIMLTCVNTLRALPYSSNNARLVRAFLVTSSVILNMEILYYIFHTFNLSYTQRALYFGIHVKYNSWLRISVQLYSNVTSVNCVCPTKFLIIKIIIHCLSYSKISAILCVLYFLFLHFNL